MPELPDWAERWTDRVRSPYVGGRDWFRIEDKTDGDGGKKTAEVWIFDVIGQDWFGEGTDAKSFARKLQDLDVDEILLHLNTPGGDAWDGVAIYNALKDHRATVTAVVEGMAASAGSFIAQAGDTVRMNRAAQMMIHDASGIVIGNAKDMEDFAKALHRMSDSIASIYAGRAGGTVAEWRAVMGRETWYTAAEAVESGLADEMVNVEPADPKARASFDLRIFNYAGRDKAPAPPRIQTQAPAGPPAGPASPQEGAGMDPAKLREALGLKADASDQDVTQAITASGLVKAEAPPPDPAKPGDTSADPEPLPPKVTTAGQGSDAVLLDPAQFRALQLQAAKGDEAWRKMKEAECDSVLDAAMKAGKFPPSRLDHYKLRWATDPDGTKDEVARLQPNAVPTSLTGFPGVGDETEAEMVYNAMYPAGGVGRG